MAFSTVFRSNTAFVIRAQRQILKSAAFAAGNVFREAAVRRAKRGMTTGNFVGQSETPLFTRIFLDVDINAMVAKVGTDVKHGKYWQEGHFNVFLQDHVRVRWLDEAKAESENDARKAFFKAADETADRFFGQAAERIVGLTPIGSLRSTIG